VDLVSRDGASVQLRPVGYQYPGIGGTGARDWDANWLVIQGDIRPAGARAWSFTDPCLTTWEARSLSDWLRAVVTGDVKPSAYQGSDDDTILKAFTEPTIALSLAARTADTAVVRVHLSLESRPPGLEHPGSMFAYFVALVLPVPALSAAIEEWDRELSPLPAR
jgi:hypothetical protein